MMDAKQLQAIEERWAKPLQEKWRHVARAKGNIENESGRGIASCHVYASNVTSEDYITENLANADRIIAAPTDIADLIAEVIRLQLAEKVCKLMQKNRGGHYCVVSKCDNCHTETVGNAGEVCWTCIDKALKEWEAAGNG